MSVNENNVNEEVLLISQAIETKCQKLLSELSDSVYINVRKAVARNNNTNSSLINKMAEREIASSVLYWLLKNPSCKIKREINQEDLNNKCVTCDISEVRLCNECRHCTR